ncbi:MAG: ABC transporter permease [Acidimicrobiia bacterium]
MVRVNINSVRIALAGIVANKMRSGLTTLGIMIGVASVIILVAVGSGSAAVAREALENLGSNLLAVIPNPEAASAGGGTQSRKIEVTDGDVEALADPANAPNVRVVVPIIVANAPVIFEGSSTVPASMQGTTPEYAPIRNLTVAAGSFFTDADVEEHNKVAVLGPTVVENLIGVGADPSQLLDQQVRIGSGQFTVIGILAPKGSSAVQDEDDVVYLPLTSTRDNLTGNDRTVAAVITQSTGSESTGVALGEMTRVMQNRHPDSRPGDYIIVSQASIISAQAEADRTFTVLLAAVAAISLLVGGIGVMNIMLVTVTERTREIGIRKAIGAKRSHILTQFLVEATLLAGIGGVIGVGTGLLGSNFRIAGTQPVVEPYSVFLAFGFAVGTGLFFGIYPANRAASLRPIDALRHE